VWQVIEVKRIKSNKIKAIVASSILASLLIAGGPPAGISKTNTCEEVVAPEIVKAQTLISSGRLDDGEGALAELLRNDTSNAKARILHAQVLNELGRYHFAAEEMKLALAANPNDPHAHLLMGKIMQNMHRPAQAIAEYKLYLASGKASDTSKQQYSTLITVLTEEAKQQEERNKSRTTKPGDYFNALAAHGSTMRFKNATDIKVYIADGKNVPGYRGEFEESLRQAFDEWSEATGGKIAFVFVNSPDNAQMKISWTDDLHAPALKAEAGHAYCKYGPDGIESSDVSLLTLDPFKDGPIGRNHLYNVCLHEIGHALGLQVHSPHEDDIMFPSLYGQQGLSHRDINTLIALYSDEQAREMPYVDEWGRPLSQNAKAERLANEGNTAAVSGQYQKAIDKLEASLQINPNNELARKNLAVCANNLAISKDMDNVTAIKLLEKGLKWDPTSELCKTNLEIFRQQRK
jgi:tetratricopeptide (TPR) repeat protein